MRFRCVPVRALCEGGGMGGFIILIIHRGSSPRVNLSTYRHLRIICTTCSRAIDSVALLPSPSRKFLTNSACTRQLVSLNLTYSWRLLRNHAAAMSKDSTAVFKKSVTLEAPARRRANDAVPVQPLGSPGPELPRAAAAAPFGVAQTLKATLPLAEMPWSEYVSRSACDLLSSSLNVAFDAVESHDLRAAMATAATMTRSKTVRSPLRESPPASPSHFPKGAGNGLPRIATASGAAPPRMEMSDFTLAYDLPQIPAWKLGYTPRFTGGGATAFTAPRVQDSTQPRDLTERAMEVDLRLPSPPSSYVSLMSPFTANANVRASRVQTALDRNNGPTKWEVRAGSTSAADDLPDDDKDESSDWSHMLSLAQSRREQAAQRLKEVDEQLQVRCVA